MYHGHGRNSTNLKEVSPAGVTLATAPPFPSCFPWGLREEPRSPRSTQWQSVLGCWGRDHGMVELWVWPNRAWLAFKADADRREERAPSSQNQQVASLLSGACLPARNPIHPHICMCHSGMPKVTLSGCGERLRKDRQRMKAGSRWDAASLKTATTPTSRVFIL